MRGLRKRIPNLSIGGKERNGTVERAENSLSSYGQRGLDGMRVIALLIHGTLLSKLLAEAMASLQ
jgi:hypothetical protein